MVSLENLASKKIVSVLLLCLVNSYFSQNKPASEVKQLQPKIIVIPFVGDEVTEGSGIKKMIESNSNLRTSLSLVKKAFDQRGFTTYDFLTAYKSAEESVMRSTSNSTSLSKNEILNRYSKADIVVEVDYSESPTNVDGNQVKIILSANVVGEASAFANEVCLSKRLNAEIDQLINQVINERINEFMATIQLKFNEIVNDGVSYYLEMYIAEGETFTFSDEIPGENDQFSYIIYDWLRKNAYKNYANNDDESETQLTYTIRIPLRDEQTGMNYTITDFQRSFRNFMKTKMFDAKFAKTEGKKLYIEIKKI